jgi:hypothetical protein
MNAFKYGCSVDGDNFCARPQLSKSLSRYIESGQNLVIQGERRIGKTSLVKETVSAMRGWTIMYADFMGVKSVSDVCNRIADAMSRFDSSDSFMRKIFAALIHLRPVATIDAMTGLPTISVDARASSDPSSVNAVMNAIESHVKGRRVCVVFDEFQDILDVKDGEQMLALMRGRIQFMPHTSFVFLGSARNTMLDIFMSPKSPFYKSAAVFDVGNIPDDDFFKFAKDRFATGQRVLPRILFDRILEFVDRTSGDVQEMCDAIWQISEPGDCLGDEHFEQGLSFVFERENGVYAMFLKPLTDIQFRVLKALAVLGGAHTLAGAFLEESNVTNTATIRRSLSSLEKTGLIYQGSSGWKFSSPFFREWVKRRR